MERRKLLSLVTGLGTISGCTSIGDSQGIESTSTINDEPCKPPENGPAKVVRITDNSLTLQSVRTESDAYPSHEAGAVGIYEGIAGGRQVLGAYRFESTNDAQGAAEQDLIPENGVVAQLQIENWLLLVQAPEKDQARSLILSAGVSGGCRRELTFFTQSVDGFQLGSSDNPWQGAAIDLKDGSPSKIRDSIDRPVPVILTGDTVHTAYVETRDYEALQQSAKESGFDVVTISPTSFEGIPICDIGSRIRISREVSKSEVDEAFTNAIRISKVASASGRSWLIFSRLDSASEISDRIDDIGVDHDEVLVRTYQECDVNREGYSS